MANQIRGIGVPFQFTTEGYPRPSVDAELLGDSIFSILSTIPGERPMRPTFGSYLRRFVFMDMSRATAIQARTEVFRAINQWESRVTVLGVTFNLDTIRAQIELTVTWTASGLATNATILEFPE
jgi:phage baseplate assembly protein W